ncbi:ankyrin repeat domain-containing protein [Paraburkholderia sp. C35]|uniref:ankyrin repeat domain-containing protein n=1 Tax=Paraburkholderia sp. C35 TaxID=2126993 RepID=UPI000D6916AB|nr:ankyrin repeat domain-containing protein [Paraburkholderia sp. C35]
MGNTQSNTYNPLAPIAAPFMVLVPDATGKRTFDPALQPALEQMFWNGIRGDVPAMKAMLDMATTAGCASTFRFTAYQDTGVTSWLSPLHLMVMVQGVSWNDEIATLLIDAGHSIDAGSDNGTTALMAAAINGNAQAVSAILALGANENLYDRHGRTALFSAAAWGETDCVQRLVVGSVNPNLSDHDGQAPCDTAEACGYPELAAMLRPLTIQRIKAKGTDPYPTLDDSGYSLLHCFAEMGQTAAVEAIASVKGYKPPRTAGGLTPAHLALLHGHGETAVAALGAGGDYSKLEPLVKNLRKKGFNVPSVTTLIVLELHGQPYRSV